MKKGFLLILLAIFLSACNPVKDSDLVIEQEEIITNSEKFEAFIENLNNGKEDKIRIVRRTTEGDPIFDTLDYNGENITYTHDNSHDKYADSSKGTQSGTCENIDNEQSENERIYRLSGCSSEIGKYFELEVSD
ncbi:hypothetical protein B481_0201 [Planococcus halocryophilus Or1]|uniref:DUF4362 domain-containing protein n=1 Tax=Planococcus halocryophilus TaxID=1215089 RepID=A0A1C7DSS0_9BACL|nr:DUF4362 domain-containing protein [Planococcus halocryophilus]ANU14447.1 hypothetical protein BBI08_11440 [Planococcus halocryophilus]EMF48085.1 hypothetical protein B481_0201 [Planococcus halocryophilus Or1]